MLGPFFLYVEQVNKYLGSSFSGNSKKKGSKLWHVYISLKLKLIVPVRVVIWYPAAMLDKWEERREVVGGSLKWNSANSVGIWKEVGLRNLL